MLTAERLRKLLHYDPETGIWRWRLGRRGRRSGNITNDIATRRRLTIDHRTYLSSRLAWLYVTGVWPTHEVDHRDGDPSNDRWSNLRAATHQQNQQNTKLRSDNTSGFKGVCWHQRDKRWRVRIGAANEYIGVFKTREEAAAAYAAAARARYGEFAREA